MIQQCMGRQRSLADFATPNRWRVGCCGFALSQKQYFETFELIEIQQTFYQPPENATLHRWREQAPDLFVFTLKAWQLITHEPTSPTYKRLRHLPPNGRLEECGSFRPTNTVFVAWERTVQAAYILKAEAIVLQCPASFKPTETNVANLRRFMIEAWNTINRLKWDVVPCLVWEPRGNWEPALVKALCRELQLVHCVDPSLGEPVTEPPIYLRLHGGPSYNHQYTDQELTCLADRMRQWQSGWCLFNNRTMVQDALRLIRLLAFRAANNG